MPVCRPEIEAAETTPSRCLAPLANGDYPYGELPSVVTHERRYDAARGALRPRRLGGSLTSSLVLHVGALAVLASPWVPNLRWEFRPPSGHNSPALAASVSSPPREAAAITPVTLPSIEAQEAALVRRAPEPPEAPAAEFASVRTDRRVPLPAEAARRSRVEPTSESNLPEFVPPKRSAPARISPRETAIPYESVASKASAGSSGARTDAPPKVLYRVDVYPAEALAAGIEGTVRLNVRVNAQGEVIAAAIRFGSGHAVLDQAALEAIHRWRFEPLGNDRGEVAEFVQPIRFRINRD